jgi:hypothetical protein
MMIPKKIRQAINIAIGEVSNEIGNFGSRSRVAAGMASEGYSGGYRDALHDVLLLLNGNIPNRRHYWYHLTDKGK